MATTDEADTLSLPVALERTAQVVDQLQALGIDVDEVDHAVAAGDGRAARVQLTLTIPAEADLEAHSETQPEANAEDGSEPHRLAGAMPASSDGRVDDDGRPVLFEAESGRDEAVDKADDGVSNGDREREDAPSEAAAKPRELSLDTTESAVVERSDSRIEPVATGSEEVADADDRGDTTDGDAVDGRPLPDGEELDHTDEAHLRWAYDAHDTIKEATAEFGVSYHTVRSRLVQHDIHVTAGDIRGQILAVLEERGESTTDEISQELETSSSYYRKVLRELVDDGRVSTRKDPEDGRRVLYRLAETNESVDETSGPTPEPRSVDWDALEPAVVDHDGPLLDEEPQPDGDDADGDDDGEEKAWPYRKLDESRMSARVGLPEVLDAVESEGPSAWTSYVAAELGVSDNEARDALSLLGLKQEGSSKLLEKPALGEQIAEIREEVTA
ncbi:winged helix-turn-helix domain-containing protein [Halobaculum sp. CBA1158]|uniref:winged helix-turn-helix domain-containing protein n=1 Tax=Halobaculum sp. CBA1158 TaxID=2904243 RepID=UPI001F3D8FF7|nr:winged helix-turn-helix domain-containing protein [Halobaculum sp. CBA1158]UIP00308.1 winged helix-turn-helix domain-containing protein [Halobaculum sp. CBA1158]